jgi:receptor protein-tyrosine kinase
MELRDYLRIARRRWMTILVVTLLAITATALFTLRATPQYASSARLFISTPESTSDQAYTGGLFSQGRVMSYADLLTGEEISRRVVDRLNLDQSPRDLAEQITAVAKPDTVVLSITVVDSGPERAQLLTQTVAEEFVLYVKELETPEGKTTAPVKASIVDRATDPDEPVSPRPVRNLALATIVGLLLGAGGAILRETLDTSVNTPEELANAANNAPLLGSINFDKDAIVRPLITDLNGHAPRVESFRVLRTNLQFVNVDHESKVYVVTSSVPEEGKSTTVSNLALTLAHSGENVVLVEADLRRPKAAEYLKLEGSVGVTTILMGRVDIDDAMQSGPWNLKVIAAGSIPPNPAELLQSAAMKSLIKELRERFDIVLIDAPPLLPVTDAAILASSSDGAILIARHGKTTRDQISVAVGRLESVGAHLLGTVANMTPARRGSYGYGYSYGYAPEAGRSKKDTSSKKKDAAASKKKDAAASKKAAAVKKAAVVKEDAASTNDPGSTKVAPRTKGASPTSAVPQADPRPKRDVPQHDTPARPKVPRPNVQQEAPLGATAPQQEAPARTNVPQHDAAPRTNAPQQDAPPKSAGAHQDTAPVKLSRKERRRQKKQERQDRVDATYGALLEHNERVARQVQTPRPRAQPPQEAPPTPPAIAEPRTNEPKSPGSRRGARPS